MRYYENCFKKILLPVDKTKNSKKAVKFVGSLINSLYERDIELILLNIVTFDEITEKLKNIDFRAMMLQDREFADKIIQEYTKNFIIPFLDRYKTEITDKFSLSNVRNIVEIGDPGNKIIEIAEKENVNTVMMARRAMTKFRKIIFGSVSEKVLYGLLNKNIYLIGQKEDSLIYRILIPVDGSEYSMKAVEHGVFLAKYLKALEKIVILRVINVSHYLERTKQGIDPETEAEEILMDAKRRFINTGVSLDLIETKSKVGFPKEEIIREIQEFGYDLVIMGRKGRSAIKDLVFGSVSAAVLNHCFEQTVAIINQ
ncbi:MAG: universal stress protein [Thermodesulfovibrio sp.]|nr:universal stress protein [Thermodesulfovibrio sp.]